MGHIHFLGLLWWTQILTWFPCSGYRNIFALICLKWRAWLTAWHTWIHHRYLRWSSRCSLECHPDQWRHLAPCDHLGCEGWSSRRRPQVGTPLHGQAPATQFIDIKTFRSNPRKCFVKLYIKTTIKGNELTILIRTQSIKAGQHKQPLGANKRTAVRQCFI